jgi:FtsP/CotA-like multicopper oxidase with cupredoxin domain
MKTRLTPIAAAMVLSLMAGSALAVQDFYLAAKTYSKTLPDGSSVPMWGYVEDVGGACYNAAGGNLGRMACVNSLPIPGFPGPRLVVPAGETAVRIFLTNGLPEPTSIMIPGQELPFSATTETGPTWNDGSTGARTSASQRVRSFGLEAPAQGGRRPYVWNSGRGTPFTDAGTFIYHSGTHPQKQVYMGLAGMLTRDAAAGQVYPGVGYDNEVALFYSDIDPAFNAAVAAGTLGSAVGRHPTWFLINGEPYVDGMGDIATGLGGTPLAASNRTLLRLASTASDTHTVVLQGMDMRLHGEDGNPYTWQMQGVSDTAAGTPAPRRQYSAMMPPGKTKDAIIIAPSNDRFAVYDGDGYMTNPSDPADENVADTVGGMIRFLAFGAGVNDAPVAAADSVSVVAGLSATFSPLANDTDPEGDALQIAAYDTAGMAGSVSCLTGANNGTCTFDATGLGAGTVTSFSYTASDGASVSAPTTVTVTVTANQPPVANDDAGTTDAGMTVNLVVTANDSDPEGQPLSVGGFDATSVQGGTVSCAGDTCSYTPAGGFTGTDSFSYMASDGVGSSAPATVTVTVNPVVPPNSPPVANADTATTTRNVQVQIDVLGNDTDADAGDVLTIVAHDTQSSATPVAGTIGCATGVAGGTCTYTPPTDFVGTDTFSYTVSDGTATATASVTVTVDAAGAALMTFSTAGAGAVPNVSGPYDDADLYAWDGTAFTRSADAVSDLGLPNNADVDGLSVVNGITYLSFAAATTNVPGLGGVPDEDVVAFNGSSWSTYFDGSACGLDASNGQDLDAIAVVGSTLYFSIAGGGASNPVTGVAGSSDDADIYRWDGAACAKEKDAGSDLNLPGNADIDGLAVLGPNHYRISFRAATSVPGLGTVQDESVVEFNNGTWTLFFSGAGQLDGGNAQNIDAIDTP